MENILSYCLTLVSLVSLDSLWIGVIAKNFYASRLGFLFSDHILFWPLIIFYPLYAAGLFFFAVHPAVSDAFIWKALYCGAFIGLLAYASYDLTNQATISSWPTIVTIIDVAWGIILSGFASFVAAYLTKLIFQ